MTADDDKDSLDAAIRTSIQMENQRTAGKPKDGPSGEYLSVSEDGVREINSEDDTKKLAPWLLKQKACKLIEDCCDDLVSKGWVTNWEIRGILTGLAPKYGVTQYLGKWRK